MAYLVVQLLRAFTRSGQAKSITDNTGMLTAEIQKKMSARLLLVCVVAATVGLSMAWISIGKFALFVFGSAFLAWQYFIANPPKNHRNSAAPHYTTRAILLALIAFSVSLLWTTAYTADSLGSIAKYGKLLTIVLIPLLLRSKQEVVCAITVFVAAQLFLVSSSWLLFFGANLPWATSQMATREFAVFSTYLDQGVMSATTAAICWHLRGLAPGKWGRLVFSATALLCMSNVLFVLIGRSGHVVAIVLLSLAVMWELPKRYRWAVLVVPIILLAGALTLSPKVQKRAMLMKSEIQTFSFDQGVDVKSTSSSGLRLHFWHRSIQSIAQSPLLGSGVGSWSNEYDRIEKIHKPVNIEVNKRGNPHQEYLLWGVQLGVPGVLLFLSFLVAVFRDTMGAEKASSHAAQSVLVALAVACLFNSSIYDALIGDFFCVALGLMLALTPYRAKPTPDSKALPP